MPASQAEIGVPGVRSPGTTGAGTYAPKGGQSRLAKAQRPSGSQVLATFVVVAGFGLFFHQIRLFESPGTFDLVFFALLIASTGLLQLSLPQGGSMASAAAPVIAVLIIFPFSEAVWIVAVGMALLVMKVGRPLVSPAKGMIAAGLGSAAFYAFGGVAGQTVDLIASIAPLIALAVVFFLADVSLEQYFRSAEQRMPFRQVWIGGLQLLGPVYLALSSTGILMALMHERLPYWGALLLVLALLATRHSFNLYVEIKQAYADTIRALSKVVDLQDPGTRSNPQSVADTSVDIARELGFSSEQLERLNYAALLADLGKITFDPEPGEEEASPDEVEKSHARISAEMVGEVQPLRDTTEMIRYHHTPALDVPEGTDAFSARCAQVIHAADVYHRLVTEDSVDPVHAIRQITYQQGARLDAQVVRALQMSLCRKGTIPAAACPVPGLHPTEGTGLATQDH